MLHALQDEWWTALDRSGQLPLMWGPFLDYLHTEEYFFDARTLRQALESMQQGAEENPRQFARRYQFLLGKCDAPSWFARDALLHALNGSTKVNV